jgi:hypothetical protein
MARAACLQGRKVRTRTGSTEGEAPLGKGRAAARRVGLAGSHAAGLFFGHDPEETAECASP